MQSFIASAVLLALAALPAMALPAAPAAARLPIKFSGCPITASPPLPLNQTALKVGDGLKPLFVALGMGVQNYTCTDAGVFASAGAVATLYDVSCIINSPLFTAIPPMAARIEQRPAARTALAAAVGKTPLKLADHYFIPAASGTGISPKFDAGASSKGFVTAKKDAGIPSPKGAAHVDWLQLSAIDGTLSKQVFRVDTVNGQPAASCTPKATASIPYAATYWFLG